MKGIAYMRPEVSAPEVVCAVCVSGLVYHRSLVVPVFLK
jgi:hypothetical protein